MFLIYLLSMTTQKKKKKNFNVDITKNSFRALELFKVSSFFAFCLFFLSQFRFAFHVEGDV